MTAVQPLTLSHPLNVTYTPDDPDVQSTLFASLTTPKGTVLLTHIAEKTYYNEIEERVNWSWLPHANGTEHDLTATYSADNARRSSHVFLSFGKIVHRNTDISIQHESCNADAVRNIFQHNDPSLSFVDDLVRPTLDKLYPSDPTSLDDNRRDVVLSPAAVKQTLRNGLNRD